MVIFIISFYETMISIQEKKNPYAWCFKGIIALQNIEEANGAQQDQEKKKKNNFCQ